MIDEIAERLTAELGITLDALSRMPADELAKRTPKVSGSWASLCAEIGAWLCTPAVGRNTEARVALVRLVAAVPESGVPVMLGWLTRKDPRHIAELHFTCFCYLDDAWLAADKGLQRRILESVRQYLLHVESNRAHAAWMAGDLLGDHLDLTVTLPVLLELAEKARYAAGRMGALHGLTQALRRCSRPDRDAIMKVLGSRVKSERSRRVQHEIESILSTAAERGSGRRPRSGPQGR